ncbi:MAG TPA: DinB family protein, partial [Cytophagales bacterium]|nr:DinB family protein [Cytophagales bacterium]
MNPHPIIRQLEQHIAVFQGLLEGQEAAAHRWRPRPDHWCLLEIVCHLYDEERKDFRARTRQALTGGKGEFIPINPEGWVSQHEYLKQDYTEVLRKFLKERAASVAWLRNLQA